MLQEKANDFFYEKKWEKAGQAFEIIVNEDALNGNAWFHLGLSNHYLKQYKEAISAYLESEKLHYAPLMTRYNLACAFSLLNEKEKALKWLMKAIEVGFSQVQLLSTDPDLLAAVCAYCR